MRKGLVVGNWKMNKIKKEAVTLATEIKKALVSSYEIEVVLCPPFTVLRDVYETIKDSKLKLGGQDLFWEREGAFTGEVSGYLLKDCGCEFVIVGHSERRRYLKETNEMISKKIKSALKEGLIPILCVGETLEEREKGVTQQVIRTQLIEGIGGLHNEQAVKLVIAYEPVWAIGTGRTAYPYQAEEVQKFIREWIRERFSPVCAENVRILYGGSVTSANIGELIKEEDIDGVLVGGASLKSESFIEIIKKSAEQMERCMN